MNGGYANGYGGYGNSNGYGSRGAGGYGGLGRRDPNASTSPSQTYARPGPLQPSRSYGSPDARSRGGYRDGPATKQIEDVLAYIKREWKFMLENNCIPVQVASQLLDESSLGLAHRYDEFQRTQEQLQNALRAIVNEHHQGFNSSIGTFHQLQASIQASHERIRNLKDELVQAKSNLSTANPEWTRLIASSQNYASMLDELSIIEQIQQAPEKLEASISDKRFLSAVEILQDSLKLIRRPEMDSINALNDTKTYISNQERSLADILIEELHNHLYLKSPYCEDRWLNYTVTEGTNAREGPLGDYHPLIKFLDELEATITTPMTEDTSKNPEADSFHYIRVLTESLSNLGRLDEAIDSIEERLPIELFKVVERSNSEVQQRHPKATPTNPKNSTSVVPDDPLKNKPQTAVLRDLLETLYAKFEAIAESHRVFHDVVAGVSKRDTVMGTNNQRLTRGFKGLWQLYQSEMRSLLHDYLSTGGDASQRSGQGGTGEGNIFRYQRERNKKCNFKLSTVDTASSTASADIKQQREDLVNTWEKFVPGLVSLKSSDGPDSSSTSSMHHTTSGQSPDSTAAGHKLLVEPSVFNIGTLLPPSVVFLNRLKAIVPPNSDIVVSTLSSFLNDFLINVFHPQLEETLIDYCSQSFIQLDSFQTESNWPSLAQKPIFKGTVKFFNIVAAFCKMLDDLTHDQIFSQLLINQMNAYYDRCAAWYKTLVTRASEVTQSTDPSSTDPSSSRRYKASAQLSETPSITTLTNTLLNIDTSSSSSSASTSLTSATSAESTALITHAHSHPLTERDLITDRKSQTHLCLLYTSLTWLSVKLSSLRRISDRATNSSTSSIRDSTFPPPVPHPQLPTSTGFTTNNAATALLPDRPLDSAEPIYIPLNRETAALYDGILGAYRDLAATALRTLHLEFRTRCLQRLGEIFHGSFIYNSSGSSNTAASAQADASTTSSPTSDDAAEATTPDEPVLTLISDLLRFDAELPTYLPQHTHAFVTRGTMALVDAFILSALSGGVTSTSSSSNGSASDEAKSITAMNSAGAAHLRLNARVLHHNLINIEPGGSLAGVFEFVRLFEGGSNAILSATSGGVGGGRAKKEAKAQVLTKEQLRACLTLWYSDATSNPDRDEAAKARKGLERGLKELG